MIIAIRRKKPMTLFYIIVISLLVYVIAFPIYLFIVLTRPNYNPYYEPGMLPNEHRFLLERLQKYGQYCDDDVLVIFDKIHDKDDGRIALGFKRFLFTHATGRHYSRIVELPLFVASQTHPLIHFPDLSGNIIRKYYGLGFNEAEQLPQNDYEKWLVELYARISAMSLRLSNQRGGYDYGIYEMPVKFLINPVKNKPL
ncbi:MAG TPA: hypothetical protein PKW67_09545 [Syntrophomonadaceae bacterium]|nr:hypothetical protein [Syntrophomonadaceae bacterium]